LAAPGRPHQAGAGAALVALLLALRLLALSVGTGHTHCGTAAWHGWPQGRIGTTVPQYRGCTHVRLEERNIMSFSGVALQIAASVAGAVVVGAAVVRASFPKLNNAGSKAPIFADAGACRVRFPAGPAAQVYFPTAATRAEAANSYAYMRPAALVAMCRTLRKPIWLFKLFGLEGAPSPCITSLEREGLGVRPPAAGKPGELPIILFSHGLYGHCDLHATLGRQLAQQGYVVVVIEHEGRAASYCRTEKGEVKTYLRPPEMSAEQAASREGFLGFCRSFRRPILEHREREMATVVRCLHKRVARALCGNGDEFGEGEDDRAAFRMAQGHLDHLLGRVNARRLVMGGHSFGGCSAIITVQSELPELRGAFHGCLLFDPWTEPLPASALEKGLGDLPTFVLLSEEWPELPMFELTSRLLRPDATSRAVVGVLPGSKHAWVSDVPFWFPGALARATKQSGAAAADECLRTTVDASLELLGPAVGSGVRLPDEKRVDVSTHGIERLLIDCKKHC
jgi:dienelactone hydrolase